MAGTEALEPPATAPRATASTAKNIAEVINPAEYGLALADAIYEAMPGFVARILSERTQAFASPQDPARLFATATDLKNTITTGVDAALRTFFISDIDTQRTTPLSIIRTHMIAVTALLRQVHCAPADRDAFDQSSFPEDVFAVGPYAWSDFGEIVNEAGLRWGAAKAMAHRQRHQAR